MKTILLLLFLFIINPVQSQIYTDKGSLTSGWLRVKLDRYKTNGLREGYRGMVDLGLWPGIWGSVLERQDGKVARFVTPMELIVFMDYNGYKWIGQETYVLRKDNKDVWTTVWIFYKSDKL